MAKVKVGYNNLLILMAYVVELGETATVVYEDGKVSVGDMGALIDLYKATTDLGSVDFKAVLPEAKDLDPKEMSELCDMIKDRFDLKDDAVEAKVEKFISITCKLYSCVKEAMGLIEELSSDA